MCERRCNRQHHLLSFSHFDGPLCSTFYQFWCVSVHHVASIHNNIADASLAPTMNNSQRPLSLMVMLNRSRSTEIKTMEKYAVYLPDPSVFTIHSQKGMEDSVAGRGRKTRREGGESRRDRKLFKTYRMRANRTRESVHSMRNLCFRSGHIIRSNFFLYRIAPL